MNKVTRLLKRDNGKQWPDVAKEALGIAWQWGDDVVIQIKEHKETRRDSQRKLMWVWHTEFVKFRFEHFGEVFSKEHWHEVWKEHYLGCTDPVKIMGKWSIKSRSTGELSVKEMAETLTRYEADAAQDGCIFTKPDDCYLKATMRERMDESERDGM